MLCIAGAVLAVALSGFYSGAETGLYCLNRLRLGLDADSGDPRARRLAHLLAHDQSALSTLLVGTNVANYLATAFVAYLLTRPFDVEPGISEIYTTIIVTPAVFVFGEIVPKTLFQRHADRLMRLGSALFSLSAVLLRIPVVLLNQIAKPVLWLVDPTGLAKSSDPRRKTALLLQNAMVTAHSTDDDHIEFVDRVLCLTSIPLHRVMVPRNRVVSIRADAGRKECLSLIRKYPHSRFLVFDRNPRRIIGHISIHTLLADDKWVRVRDRLKPVVSIPVHDSVASAIMQLQSSRETMAILVDRSGYLLGMVTLKDLLEELTGELHAW